MWMWESWNVQIADERDLHKCNAFQAPINADVRNLILGVKFPHS